MRLPELFTVASAEYEAIHSAWHKAIKTFTRFYGHSQTGFGNIKEKLRPDLQQEDQSFYRNLINAISTSDHSGTTIATCSWQNHQRKRMRMQSNFSSLCKGTPYQRKSGIRKRYIALWRPQHSLSVLWTIAVLWAWKRLSEEDIIGTNEKQGLLEQYFTLSREAGTPMQDIALRCWRSPYWKQRLSLHTLSDTDDLPRTVSADTRFEKPSPTVATAVCRSLHLWLLLSCNHIYNQYLFLDNSEANLQKFEKSASEYALIGSVQPCQPNQQRVDRKVPERSTSVRAFLCSCAF